MDPYLRKLTQPVAPIPSSGNGHAKEPELRSATDSVAARAAELRTLSSVLIERMQFLRQAGVTFKGMRDTYDVLGYDRNITSRQYRDRYARGGIAKPIIEAFPKATWRGGFEILEDESPKVHTKFEKTWLELEERLRIVSTLQKVDILSGLSTYAILLIGAPGELNEELKKGQAKDLLYLTPFAGGGGPNSSNRNATTSTDADATIVDFEIDIQNPRFGRPRTYQIKRTDVLSPELMKSVHWSRVIHVAEGCLDDEVYGQPALESCWNLLDDLDKVTGGGAEAFWLRANQGLHLDVDKDMQNFSAAEKESLKDQADEYQHQMRRMMRTRGVTIESLGSDVANFSNPADAILTQIAGTKRIPKRILTGSEMGELASSQDRDNWKDQVNGRQTGYADPNIIRQLVDRLIAYGYLPAPSKPYIVKWPQIETLTETEKATGAKSWAEANQTYGKPVFTDAEIRDKWYGLLPLTPEQIEAAMPPQKVEEAPPREEVEDPRRTRQQDDEEEEDTDLRAAQSEEWKVTPQGLVRVFTFPDRRVCASFLTAIFEDANTHNHHPDVETSVDSVTVTFVTHSEGNTVTKLDHEAAKRVDGLAVEYKALGCVDDSVTRIPLRPAAQLVVQEAFDESEREMLQVLEAAILANNTEVINRIIGLGGPGSGNFSHGGRKGKVGGSAPDVDDGWEGSKAQADALATQAAFRNSPEGKRYEEDRLAGIKKYEAKEATKIAAKGIILYHGTSSDVVKAIKKEGLIPVKSAGADSSSDTGITTYELQGQKASVFLSADKVVAAEYSTIAQEIRGGKPVLLEISVPASEAKRIIRDEASVNSAVRIEGSIPPEWIKRVGSVSGEDEDIKVRWKALEEGTDAIVGVLLCDADASLAVLGGPGSGNFGHAGRPGTIGGSAPDSGAGTGGAAPMIPWKSEGGFENTGITWKQEVDPTTGRPIPIKVASVEEAIPLVLDGKVVEVRDVREAHTLIDRLAQQAQEARDAGQEAKEYDLCNVSVAGSNMFCGDTIRSEAHPEGIARIFMPQLGGKPVLGSEADKLPRVEGKNRVDGSSHFVAHLQGIGVHTSFESVPAASLKASQREMVGSKVGAMMRNPNFDPQSERIFISSDNYVVDGHHRWAASVGRDGADGRLGDSTMNVVRVNAPISEVLHLANAWSAKFGIEQAAGVVKQDKATRLRALTHKVLDTEEFHALSTRLDNLVAVVDKMTDMQHVVTPEVDAPSVVVNIPKPRRVRKTFEYSDVNGVMRPTGVVEEEID